jgi:bacterial/archaeal transporter family-2 protein
MQYGAMAVTAVVGATLALQVGLNATMSRHLASPMAAAFVNFAVGTAFLLVAVLWSRGSLSGLAHAIGAPWWAWCAGIMGGLYIAASAHFGPMLGGATFLALIVAGQVIAALALDHYGLLGFPVRPLDAWRCAGAFLVVAGMFLLAREA